MRQLSVNEELYAILVEASDIKDGSEWFSNSSEPLQVSRMKYESGKSFRVHHHILNPRIIKRTQEAFIVVSGRLAIDIYDIPKPKDNFVPQLIGTFQVSQGEAVLIYRGGHGVKVLESGVFYEVKAGQFDGVMSEEKAFLND